MSSVLKDDLVILQPTNFFTHHPVPCAFKPQSSLQFSFTYSPHGSERPIRARLPQKRSTLKDLGPNESSVAYKPLTLSMSLGVSEISLSANWIVQASYSAPKHERR